MHLHASIRLPEDVIADLERALQPDLAETAELTWLYPGHWRLYLVGLGYVAKADAVRVREKLAEQVRQLQAPSLSITGVEALLYDGDDSVWATLGGDVDCTHALASSISQWVHEFGFVPDRRAYHPWVQLARVTQQTTTDYLEGLMARRGGLTSQPWKADGITLGSVRPPSSERAALFEVYATLPFA